MRQPAALRFTAFAVANAAPDHRRADEIPQRIFDWRHGYGDVHQLPVFGQALRLVVAHRFAPAYFFKNPRFLSRPMRRNEQRDRLTKGLRRGVAIKTLSPFVPTLYNEILSPTDDRVAARLNDGSQPGTLL